MEARRPLLYRIEQYFAWFVVMAIIGTAIYASVGQGDYHREALINQKLIETRAGNDKLAKENGLLRLKIHELRYGTKGLERAARERLHLVRPGEVVYIFDR